MGPTVAVGPHFNPVKTILEDLPTCAFREVVRSDMSMKGSDFAYHIWQSTGRIENDQDRNVNLA